jgi:hypothetical protein
MNLSDFGSIASIISLFLGVILGFSSCKFISKSNNTRTSQHGITAGGDVTGRDKIVK